MYYQFFGLNGPPFAPAGTDAPLFLSPGHREGLAALEWGLREPSGFTMLVGEVGTGKTTLIHSLLTRQTGGVRMVFVTNPTLSFVEILRVIASQLGIAPGRAGKLDLIEALDALLAAKPQESVAIIVDEAQDLSDDTLEELRLLSNARSTAERRLQIVLVGQLELARRLERAELRQLNQRIGARALLPALAPKEVYDYVEYRLRARAGDIRKLFKGTALRELTRLSAGIPRRINILCHNALMLAYAQQARRVEARHILEAARDYDHLLAGLESAAPTQPASRTRWRAMIIRSAAAALALAALGVAYLVAPGMLNVVEPLVRASIKTPPAPSDERQPRGASVSGGANHRQSGADAPVVPAIGEAAAASTPADAAKADSASMVKIGAPSSAAPAPIQPAAQPPAAKSAPVAMPVQSGARPKTTPPSGDQAVQSTTPGQDAVLVQSGDTLSKIALRRWGSLEDGELRREVGVLVKANPQLVDANHIYPGQIIRLEEPLK
jgi:general secretion pathway protein A